MNQMNQTTKPTSPVKIRHVKPLKQYFRVDEVADYFNVSVRTIYRLIEEGELARVKIRGCLRIPLEEIYNYENKLKKDMTGFET